MDADKSQRANSLDCLWILYQQYSVNSDELNYATHDIVVDIS